MGSGCADEGLTTERVAQAVLDHWVTTCGVPMRIHSDRGLMFESEVIPGLCQLLRIHKTQTTTYRPQSDGTTERFKSPLKNMFSKTANHNPEEGDYYLPSLMMAYKSYVHSATGNAPSYLLFGRGIRLPLDVKVERPESANQTQNYAVDLVQRLEYAYALARAQMHLRPDRGKDRYDAGAVEKEIKLGHFERDFQSNAKRGVPFKYDLPWSDPREAVEIHGVVHMVRNTKSN